jgi:hypothetical protein
MRESLTGYDSPKTKDGAKMKPPIDLFYKLFLVDFSTLAVWGCGNLIPSDKILLELCIIIFAESGLF